MGLIFHDRTPHGYSVYAGHAAAPRIDAVGYLRDCWIKHRPVVLDGRFSTLDLSG